MALLLEDNRRSVAQQFGGAAGYHRRAEEHAHDGIGPQFFGFGFTIQQTGQP